MRKLSEITGEDALDVLADILTPIAEISTNQDFVKTIRSGDKIGGIKILLKDNKKEILEIMAILDGEDVETYNPSIIKLPAMLLELFNDQELVSLFQSQGTVTSSGSATESTEATGEE